jgi:hypothetical protein
MINHLAERGGTCILYTHLGKIDDPNVPFNSEAIKAFYRLAEEFHSGRILVTTTRRLLGYRRAIREIEYESNWDGEHLRIDVDALSGASSVSKLSKGDLYGLTFYVPDPRKVSMTIDGNETLDLKRNVPDHTGRPSVSLPWPFLEFPET